MTREGYFYLAAAFLVSVLTTACCVIAPIIVRPDESIDQWREWMSGPGLMRRWLDQMPGPWMMNQQFPTPEISPAPTSTPGGSARVSYRQDIQPILYRECTGCHGGQAGLYLDSFDHLMSGSANGRVVIPGNPNGSELVRRINGWSQPRMPLGRSTLSASDIEKIVTWIAEGSPNN